MIDDKENMSLPHSAGMSPPTVVPTITPIQMSEREFMVIVCNSIVSNNIAYGVAIARGSRDHCSLQTRFNSAISAADGTPLLL